MTETRFDIEYTTDNDVTGLFWSRYRDYDWENYFSFPTIEEARDYLADQTVLRWRIVKVTREVV